MIELIPAIDIRNGRCVRLEQGSYEAETIYAEDPVAVAQRFKDAGLRRLHLVDLDGARCGHMQHIDLLRAISLQTGLLIDYSGGIRTDEDVALALNSGAAMVCIGSRSHTDPEQVIRWGELYGRERIIISADLRDGYVATNGWEQQTQTSWEQLIGPFYEKGFRQFSCTDISRDGMLGGANLHLYGHINKRFPGLDLVASGGISTIGELRQLEASGCTAAIIGKAIYEHRITLSELTTFMANGTD